MALTLRPYQRAATEALHGYFDGSTGNPLVVMPTGTGKGVVIAAFIQGAIAAWPDTRVLVLTHVKELIRAELPRPCCAPGPTPRPASTPPACPAATSGPRCCSPASSPSTATPTRSSAATWC